VCVCVCVCVCVILYIYIYIMCQMKAHQIVLNGKMGRPWEKIFQSEVYVEWGKPQETVVNVVGLPVTTKLSTSSIQISANHNTVLRCHNGRLISTGMHLKRRTAGYILSYNNNKNWDIMIETDISSVTCFIWGPFEKFVDWQQCATVMQREVVTVMPSCNGWGNKVVAWSSSL
jgi:hypothetical protein